MRNSQLWLPNYKTLVTLYATALRNSWTKQKFILISGYFWRNMWLMECLSRIHQQCKPYTKISGMYHQTTKILRIWAIYKLNQMMRTFMKEIDKNRLEKLNRSVKAVSKKKLSSINVSKISKSNDFLQMAMH